MKKSLVALAALAAAGSAMAQSNVTIAGVIDTAYYSYAGQSRDGTLTLNGQGFGDGSWAGSRIRFSGVEDLGQGMKAEFWLEQGISPTVGEGMNYRTGNNLPQWAGLSTSSSGGIRQAFVGLSGDMGTIRIGRVYAALYDYIAVTPSAQLQDIPSANVVINAEYTGTYNATYASFARTKGINYQSPTFGGNFKYYGTYGGINSDTESTNIVGADLAGASYRSVSSKAHTHRLQYHKDALRLALVYQRQDLGYGAANAAATTNYYSSVGTAVGASPNTSTSTQDTTYIGGYNLGWMDVTGIYGNRTGDATAATGVVTSTTTQFSQLNFRVPVNKFEFRYTWNKAAANTLVPTTGVAASTIDWSGQMLGAAYHFSGRTKAYFFSGTEKNEMGATANDNQATRHALGLFHSF